MYSQHINQKGCFSFALHSYQRELSCTYFYSFERYPYSYIHLTGILSLFKTFETISRKPANIFLKPVSFPYLRLLRLFLESLCMHVFIILKPVSFIYLRLLRLFLKSLRIIQIVPKTLHLSDRFSKIRTRE